MSVERPLGQVLVPSQAGFGSVSITDRRQPGGGELTLERVPWEGGPAYYTEAQTGPQMVKAEAAGWAEDTWFPISVYYGKPLSSHPQLLSEAGINTFLRVEGGGTGDLSAVTDYVHVVAGGEYYATDFSTNDRVVGWMVEDEPEFGMSYATYTSRVNTLRANDDGMFLHTNFGPAVFRTFWYTGSIGGGMTEMDGAYDQVDATGADVYWYTSAGACYNAVDPGDGCDSVGSNWPGDPCDYVFARRSASYGWLAWQLQNEFGPIPHVYKPQTVTIETKLPFLNNDSDNTIMLYEQIEAAVFAALAGEARGIMYFQHNGNWDGGQNSHLLTDPNTGLATNQSVYSIIECEQGLTDYVADLNARVAALAPVLNTQSYVFDFGAADIDTMLKGKDGYAYIFASMGPESATGSKTFTLTGSGITGTVVDVVDEARTIDVVAGAFADTFAAESSHHVYKVAI